MKEGGLLHRILRAVHHYITFFLVIAFVVTCCTMLFVTLLANSLDVTLTDETVSAAAKLTFLNVVPRSPLRYGRWRSRRESGRIRGR